MVESVPDVACTLTTEELANRVLTWADLGPLAHRVDLRPDGASASYPLELAARLGDLAALEQACCGSWLDIGVLYTPTAVLLELTTANPEGVGLIHAMVGVTEGLAPSRPETR